ncbi:Arc family DNA-binding protein [Comamonas sp. 4034]|uniref:Arc family DNA-binding protein n=1 Tax=Comamonas sp. 4034 TaxID=3156455 RepID=UPI003D1D0906
MSTDVKPKQEPPIGVRFTPETRAFVVEQAKKNFRSLSSEIAARVERTRQEDQSVQQQGAAA